jgi:two-component system cell cycle sensor histidine kinase/response regulator CckA
LEIGGELAGHDSGEVRPDTPLSTSAQADGRLREAEERYQALFNSLDCVYLHDLEGRFLDANPAALDLLGYEREEILGLTFASLLDDAELAVAHRELAELMATGALETATEFRLRCKTGDHVYVETKSTVISREGKPYSVLGIARDVTRRKVAEASLLKAQFSLENVADAVHWIDRDGRIIDAGRSLCVRLGYSPEELLGMKVSDITVDESPESWTERWRLLKEEGPQTFEKQHRTKSGDVVPVEIRSSMVQYEGQEVVLAIARDISERKLAAEAVRQSSEMFSVFLRDSPIYSYIKVVTPTDSRILHASENYQEMLGIPSSDMIGKSMEELFPEDRAKRMHAGDLAVVSTGQTLRFEEEVEGRRFTTIKFPIARGDDILLAGYSIDVTEAREAEQALRASEQALKSYFDNAADAVFVLEIRGGRIRDCNTQACLELGYSKKELLELSAADLESRLTPAEVETIHRHLDEGRAGVVEGLHRRKDGSVFPVEIRLNSLAPDRPDLAVAVARDITERKRAEKELRESEEQLRQAQKMEAVGQLAGGIAHDFNNLLAAILGYCDLLLARPELADSSAREDLVEIKRAGERASTLTRQILAFSRRQALDPSVVSLGEVVSGMVPMLRRTLGEDVQLVTRVDPAAGWVEADTHQFEQVIMNLALNARDAMPSGGRLTLKVADVELSERFCRSHPGATPGSHVRLTVADAGFGMDEVTRGRAFEPFFTTKPRERGTGLGLAMVYGTVKQSNGSVFIESRPGKGTKVKIYLPRVAPPAGEGEEDLPTEGLTASTGSETVLLVEDEAALRRFVSRVLESLGYRVLAAGTAAEALQMAKKAAKPVDLLLTDVVLPGGMHGDVLARELTALQPGLPVLYVSGYPHDSIVHAGRLDEGVNFLEKPFTPQALTSMVRSLLERAGPEDQVPQ